MFVQFEHTAKPTLIDRLKKNIMKKMLFISALAATAVSISPAVTLEAGKTSTITLKIKDQDISFSHSITDWVDGNNGSGNVPM